MTLHARAAAPLFAACALLMAVAGCTTAQVDVEANAPTVAAAPTPATPVSATFTPDKQLFICPKMEVLNAPPADPDRRITTYAPFIAPAPGVLIAVAPTNGACFSSGFGDRRGKLHKGIDLHSRPASMIHAAGDGVVVEKLYRDDYGNMVILDHGGGVYTRYAHLANFEGGYAPGDTVPFGTPLGVMGRTSAFRVALHLHYEVLMGDIDNPKGSFGLTPIDPMKAEKVAAVVE